MVDFSSRINRQRSELRRLFEKKGKTTGKEGEWKLLFRPSPDEEYTFEEGRVLINGMDLQSILETDPIDVELFDSLIKAIDLYRREVWSRYGTQYRDFNAKTQGLLERASTKLGNTYEEMSGGIRVRYASGRLWVNDIDPKMVLQMFLSNPTQDRRSYLKSIQTKLVLILEGKAGRAVSNGVFDEAKRVILQIATALENTAAHTHPPLLPAFGNLGST